MRIERGNGVPVEVRGITKEFPGHIALKGVDLSVEARSFTTLLGPSGCGKTTLLRILAGFETATAGSVDFDGKDVARMPAWKRNIGFVFQNYALWPHMTIRDNVAYGLGLRKMRKAEIAERATEALRLVGLDARADSFPGQLSGGQQQRVAIARALALRPNVLLLDEPLSNLDAKMRIGMRQELLRLQREVGITAVYVTHDQEEALEMSDQVAVMHDGRIDQVGSPQEIYERPTTAFVSSFVGHVTLLSGVSDGRGGFETDLTVRGALPVLREPTPSGRAQLVLRPENLDVVDEGDAHFSGTLLRSSYQGRSYRSAIRLADGTVCEVEHRHAASAAIGEAVGVRVQHASLVPESDDFYRANVGESAAEEELAGVA
jgi:ABC-type Fe3+/spermidine/putrescine transport system ATPase subunit